MKAREVIEKRFHFVLPEDYERFWSKGLLNNDGALGIRVSRYFWLSPDEIAECPWPTYTIKSLVPCARTPGRDHFCWHVEPGGSPWIADCPRDSDFGEGVAPNFEAFVFRSLLEEFADSWITNLDNASIMFRDYARRINSVMRPNWAEIIAEYARRAPSLNQRNRPRVISEEDLSGVINRELAFGSLNKKFRQNMD